MGSKSLATAAAVLALGVSVAVAPATAQAKPFGFGGPHHFHHRGFGLAAGLFGAAVLGAAASSAAYAGDCYVVNRPTYDGYGYFVGYRSVQVCE